MDMRLGQRFCHDIDILREISTLASSRTYEEIEQAFPVYVRRQIITRFLAYYELFKLVQDMPGWIVECGVYRGFSLFALAKFLEIFCMGDKTRKVIGFDNFAGFTSLDVKDGTPNPDLTKHIGGTNPSDFKDDFMRLLELANQDCFAPWAERLSVVVGDVDQTVPKYCKEHPGLTLSMLHIDIDLYAPVKVCLEEFYPRLLPGGIVVLDEFAHLDWPGETKAVQEVFLDNGWPLPEFKTLNWVGTPTTYFKKGHF